MNAVDRMAEVLDCSTQQLFIRAAKGYGTAGVLPKEDHKMWLIKGTIPMYVTLFIRNYKEKRK
jgi:hypothetical protein